MVILSFSFFVTAILYAAVGFGGGSTYNALLVLGEVDYRLLPIIALLCNLIVVTGGVWRFWRSGHVEFGRILPFVLASVPMALFGGMIEVSETVFLGVLGGVLLVSGFNMLGVSGRGYSFRVRNWGVFSAVIGGCLGIIAGLVGIGGGIFLAPILHLFNWGRAKEIAAACCLFIFVNSVSGLLGQYVKIWQGDMVALDNIFQYGWLFLAVLVGGQIGSYLGAERFNAKIIEKMTGILILYVALRLLWRFAIVVLGIFHI